MRKLILKTFASSVLNIDHWFENISPISYRLTCCKKMTSSFIAHYLCIYIIIGRNEVVAKVMFLLVSVILSTGGVYLSACWNTTPPESRPPGADTPSGSRHPLGADIPLGADTPRHMVNERPVRILLECILVSGFNRFATNKSRLRFSISNQKIDLIQLTR